MEKENKKALLREGTTYIDYGNQKVSLLRKAIIVAAILGIGILIMLFFLKSN